MSQPTAIQQTDFVQNFEAFTTGGVLYITAEVNEAKSYNLQLRDLTGRLLVTEVTPEASKIQMQLPVNYLAGGCYILSFVSNQAVYSKKVMIVK